ncbi:MAG: hypothetical protein ACRDYU_16050 [Actinomycetes bacterium]
MEAAPLRRIRAVWVLYGVVLVATLLTYGRLAPEETYHVSRSGIEGALSRAVTYLSYPVALAALALVWLRCRGVLAWCVGAACAVVAVPGVVSPDDLDAQPVNLVPALAVLVAVVLTWRDGRADARVAALPLGPVRVGLMVVLALWSVPWVCAALGFHAGDVPLLDEVVRSSEPTPGEPGLASVHLGLHEGLFGAQLAVTALVLTTLRPLPRGLSPYLALMLCYGIAVSLADGWNEQVVKRGWSDVQMPDVLEPALTLDWLGVLAASALVHLGWFRREARRTPPRSDAVSP